MCLAQHASQATAALPFAMRHTQTAPLQSHKHKFAGLQSETAKCDACLMSRVKPECRMQGGNGEEIAAKCEE